MPARRRASTPLQQRLQERLKAHKRPKRPEHPAVIAERKKRKAKLDLRKRENTREMRLNERSNRAGGSW